MLRLLLSKAQGCKDFWKHLNLSCWHSLDSSPWVLSDGYPCARVSVIYQFFLHHFVFAKLATISKRVKKLFDSCNPTLRLVVFTFSALTTPNQHQACIKHIFEQKIIQKYFLPTYLPYSFFGPSQETDKQKTLGLSLPENNSMNVKVLKYLKSWKSMFI